MSRNSQRYRRFGRFRPIERDGETTFERLPHSPFQQSAETIALYEGKAREFAPIEDRTFGNRCFRELLAHDFAYVRTTADGSGEWILGVHMIRVVADADTRSAPAPEGRHSDGHEFVAMHLISRSNTSGGDSRIYRKDADEPLYETTLRQPLETLVLNDELLEHEVTPIAAETSGLAIRDMLIVDFDRPQQAG